MAFSKSSCCAALAVLFFVALASTGDCDDGLSVRYYEETCPNVEQVVRSVMAHAVAGEPGLAPAILRLFFHDCFVNGCDGSVLLDATSFSSSEKDANPNASLHGFQAIDEIKSALEHDCPATVSCADVVALASRDAVAMLGGPAWNVPLGRKDSRAAADKYAVELSLPAPNSTHADLVAVFREHGLDGSDMTALSGAHTVGRVRCLFFRGRIYTEPNINATFAAARQQTCPQAGGDGNLAPFDDQTPDAFDNAYYKNLVAQRGLLHSDQELFNGGSQDALVKKYSGNTGMFATDFAKAMVRMGGLMPAAGTPTEVRLNCRKVN